MQNVRPTGKEWLRIMNCLRVWMKLARQKKAGNLHFFTISSSSSRSNPLFLNSALISSSMAISVTALGFLKFEVHGKMAGRLWFGSIYGFAPLTIPIMPFVLHHITVANSRSSDPLLAEKKLEKSISSIYFFICLHSTFDTRSYFN